MKGCFMFQWEGLFFRWGEASFLIGGHQFCWGGGLKKNPRMGRAPPMPLTMGNPVNPSLIFQF